MKVDWDTCLAQWERISKNYSLPILCGLRDSTPDRRMSGTINSIEISGRESPDKEKLVEIKIREDGKSSDTTLVITKENLFVMSGGRDSNGRAVFLSEELNEKL